MITGVVVVMTVAVGVIMVMGVIMVVGVIMVMMMRTMVMMIIEMIIIMVLRFRLPGAGDSHRISPISASACFTHNYSFCSTSKDFICSSVPRISLMPCLLHSGQWLNIPSGV